MILYVIGSNGYYQGTMEYPDDPDNINGIPYGTTKKAVPNLSEGQYAVWNGSGWDIALNAPQPEIPVKFVPELVTKYQAKMALIQAGLYTQIDQFIRDSNDNVLKVAWYDAAAFQRSNPFISTLGSLFNLTEEQIDDLFITASQY